MPIITKSQATAAGKVVKGYAKQEAKKQIKKGAKVVGSAAKAGAKKAMGSIKTWLTKH